VHCQRQKWSTVNWPRQGEREMERTFLWPYIPKTNSDEKVLDECPVGGWTAEVPAGVMREETKAAINRLKKNRSPGVDNISAEELQAAGQSGVDLMFQIVLWVSVTVEHFLKLMQYPGAGLSSRSRPRDGLETYQRLVSVSSQWKLSTSRSRPLTSRAQDQFSSKFCRSQ